MIMRLDRKGKSRGFTLVEMLAVVAVISILSSVAYFSMRQNRYEREMNRFSSEAIAAIKEARTRAIAANRRYVVWFTEDSVQWCEHDCPPQDEHEAGARFFAGPSGARAVRFADIADFNLAAMPASYEMFSKRIYFYPDGTMDSNPITAQPEGFTLYLQHETKPSLKRRIVVLPLSGEIRQFNIW